MPMICRCTACGRLTMMSICPRCEGATEHCPPAMAGWPAAADAVSTDVAPARVSWSMDDVNVLWRRGSGATADVCTSHSVAPSSSSTTVAALEATVACLRCERDGLLKSLQDSRRQMLRSAMDVRDLHATHKAAREKDLHNAASLRRENAQLRKQLQALGVTVTGQDTTPSSPVQTSATPRSSSQSSSSPVRVCTAVQTSDTDSPRSVAELVHLQSVLALKTQQLDEVWDRAERAERCVQDLLKKLDCVGDITREERRNSARLSHQLEAGSPSPDDVVSLIALRDRPSAAPRTPSTSAAQFSYAAVGRRAFIKGVDAIHDG